MTHTSTDQIRFRGRSFPVLALEPDAPIDNWMHQLDAHLARSPAFFAKKSIVVDCTGLGLDRLGVVGLVGSLSERGIRVMGLTGVEPSWASDDFPPILTGGRATPAEAPETKALTPEEQANFDEIARMLGSKGGAQPALEPKAPPARPVPLIVHATVRSGQSIFHPDGDVTIIGSVSSGADVIAGGSVHVYGTVRGRVIAGAYGDRTARIFCRRLEAELLAIGGVYLTADAMDAGTRGQSAQVWLDHESVKVAKLD